jgi:hypothetical protein
MDSTIESTICAGIGFAGGFQSMHQIGIMSDTKEDTGSNLDIKGLVVKSFGKMGVGAVLAIILILYYQAESRRWDERMRVDEARWQELFKQYQAGTADAMKTIEACCQDRLQRLEDIEVVRKRAGK